MRYTYDTVYDEQFSYTIDNQKYIFKATLFNPDGDLLTITKSSVLELNLFDNIFEPWLSGTVVLDNTEDALERFVSTPSDAEFNTNNKSYKGYTVRGDGRDLLKITIIPLDGNTQDYNQLDADMLKSLAISYIFCLEDEEPIDYNGVSAKRYTITDYDLQIMKERKAFFSSSNVLGDVIDVTQLSNSDRQVETGKCLKALIKDVLNDNASIYTTVEPVSGNEITPFFEDGSSKIFYSSPAENNAYEDITYIMQRHTSSDGKNDFSFLKKENYTGEYTLQGASNLFKQAYNVQSKSTGSKFLENFTITGSSREGDSVIDREQKKPLGALEFGEKGEILEYKFFNTASNIRREKIKSQIVHSYDFTDKQFNLDIYDSNIERARTRFSENYVDNLKGKDNAPHANFIINGTQRDNLSYSNMFSEYGNNPEIRRTYGINRLLKNALITNMGVELTVKGQLFRTSGKFFSLDRAGDYIENTFDNKLLGIYFIVDVQHIFINDTEFYNKVIGIKTYHYDDPKYKEVQL